MHAASVNPEPGSNSLNNCIISPMQTISLPQSHYLSIQSFASSNSSNYSLKFVLFKVFLTDFLALIQCFFSEISVVQFSRNKRTLPQFIKSSDTMLVYYTTCREICQYFFQRFLIFSFSVAYYIRRAQKLPYRTDKIQAALYK